MRAKITKYKSTGKWYSDEIIEAPEKYRTDILSFIKIYYANYDGHIAVFELMEDGHEQPIRLVTKFEMVQFPAALEGVLRDNKTNNWYK